MRAIGPLWVLLLCAIAGTAWADDPQPSDPKHPTVLGTASDGTSHPGDDAHFVRVLGQGALATARMGALAAARATTPAVLMFGRYLQADAATDRSALTQAAGAAGLHPPQVLDAAHQALLQRLGAVSAEQFDATFLKALRDDQSASIKLLQQQARNGRAQALMSYAQHQLPVLQAHMDEAEDLAKHAPGGKEPPPDVQIESDTMHRLQDQETDRLRDAR